MYAWVIPVVCFQRAEKVPVLPTENAREVVAEDAVFNEVNDTFLFDHMGRNLNHVPEHADLEKRCQWALKRSIWQERNGLSPYLYTDQLHKMSLAERADPADPRIVYFIGAARTTGAIMISRLLLALYHPSHLYLIHVRSPTLQFMQHVASQACWPGFLGRLQEPYPADARSISRQMARCTNS